MKYFPGLANSISYYKLTNKIGTLQYNLVPPNVTRSGRTVPTECREVGEWRVPYARYVIYKYDRHSSYSERYSSAPGCSDAMFGLSARLVVVIRQRQRSADATATSGPDAGLKPVQT